MEQNSNLIEQVRGFGTGEGGGILWFVSWFKFLGFRALLTLLKSQVEETRVLSLKMIGLLLNGNQKSSNYFNKHFGFEIIRLLLSPFPVTLATTKALLGLGLNEFKCKIPLGNQSSWLPFFSENGRPENDSSEPQNSNVKSI